jgi:hypothetical protein
LAERHIGSAEAASDDTMLCVKTDRRQQGDAVER